jgi:hypothetical protein
LNFSFESVPDDAKELSWTASPLPLVEHCCVLNRASESSINWRIASLRDDISSANLKVKECRNTNVLDF